MENEELIKLVDGIYKNILDKFNPSARQLISAGKSYLKTLHSSAAASKVFNETLAKIAVNAQQGGTSDIGSALMNIVGVYKDIQEQYMNILKAFYVDLLVPLETNLEKDTKVVQFEQKKFLQQHKIRTDGYNKAASTMKKNKKKKTSAEKELKHMQALDEEKIKLDSFCEQSLKNAMTQERRRYGFVLERLCSLSNHWIAYHSFGLASIDKNLEKWNDVASTREFLPPNLENMFVRKAHEQFDDDSDGSITSVLRKTRSIDASCLDMRSFIDMSEHSMPRDLPRAKSEYNLTTSPHQESNNWDRPVVTAMYAYLSSGENQLSFLENDKIALVGDRNKGWQFGENLRTQKFGWFPIAYVENGYADSENGKPNITNHGSQGYSHQVNVDKDNENTASKYHNMSYNEESTHSRKFGDTVQYRQNKTMDRISKSSQMDVNILPNPGLPPDQPAPTLPHSSRTYPDSKKSNSASMDSSKSMSERRNHPIDGSRMVYSSNDSGFSNEPPPQPDIDYSDEDTVPRVPISNTIRSEKMLRTSARGKTNPEIGVYGTLQKKPINQKLKPTNSTGNLLEKSSNKDAAAFKANFDSKAPVKRTKSFWKFHKTDDILEGMALWKHRDLVPTENEKREVQEKEKVNKPQRYRDRDSTSTLKNSPKPKPALPETVYNHQFSQQLTKAEIDKRVMSLNQTVDYDEKNVDVEQPVDDYEYDDEQLYDESPRRRNDVKPPPTAMIQQPKNSQNYNKSHKRETINKHSEEYLDLQSTNFYDDENEVFVKTVKRKEILKQYNSSGTDTERNSTSSDAYDCIVVDDHLVAASQMEIITDNVDKSERKRYSNRNDDEKLLLSSMKQKHGKDVSGSEMRGTLLPRTKLTKSSKSSNSKGNEKSMKTEKEMYQETDANELWYDLWNNDRN